MLKMSELITDWQLAKDDEHYNEVNLKHQLGGFIEFWEDSILEIFDVTAGQFHFLVNNIIRDSFGGTIREELPYCFYLYCKPNQFHVMINASPEEIMLKFYMRNQEEYFHIFNSTISYGDGVEVTTSISNDIDSYKILGIINFLSNDENHGEWVELIFKPFEGKLSNLESDNEVLKQLLDVRKPFL